MRDKLGLIAAMVSLTVALGGCGQPESIPAPTPAQPTEPLTVLNSPNLSTTVGFATLHTNGEFSGNLDFTIWIEQPTVTGEQLLKHVRVRLEDSEKQLEILGWEKATNGFDVTFATELNEPGEAVTIRPLPEQAHIMWVESGETRPLAGIAIKTAPGASKSDAAPKN